MHIGLVSLLHFWEAATGFICHLCPDPRSPQMHIVSTLLALKCELSNALLDTVHRCIVKAQRNLLHFVWSDRQT